MASIIHEEGFVPWRCSLRRDGWTPPQERRRRPETEAVAFNVGQAIGLEMGRASSDCIQMYGDNAALLAESFDVIQRTSAVILDAITGEQANAQNAPQAMAAQKEAFTPN